MQPHLPNPRRYFFLNDCRRPSAASRSRLSLLRRSSLSHPSEFPQAIAPVMHFRARYFRLHHSCPCGHLRRARNCSLPLRHLQEVVPCRHVHKVSASPPSLGGRRLIAIFGRPTPHRSRRPRLVAISSWLAPNHNLRTSTATGDGLVSLFCYTQYLNAGLHHRTSDLAARHADWLLWGTMPLPRTPYTLLFHALLLSSFVRRS